MFTRFPGLWASISLLALLAGCATTSTTPVALDEQQQIARWQQRQNQLGRITSWSLSGKMAVKTGPKGGTATLNWEYGDSAERVELYGPFGGGRVIIEANSNGATLRDTKNRSLSGANASDVLYQRLGWRVPFDHLNNWARGLPSIGATDVFIDSQGRLKSLVQGNWQVEYEEYRPVKGTDIPGLMLPYRINVRALPGTMALYSKSGEYIGDDLSVKLLLKRWWGIGLDQ